MSFKDVFKKSFLEGFATTQLNGRMIFAALAIAAVLALYIFFVYRIMTRKTFYSKNFGISLVGVALITAALILTMQSSVVISLGMVGALSIVRFRTAVKDPLDLMFLFWSISVGIICGAGMAQIAVILSLALTAGILLLEKLPVAKAPMILVVNADGLDAEERICGAVAEFAKHYSVKSRNVTAGAVDLVLELRCAQGAELVKAVNALEGIRSVSLMSHDGEVSF